SLGLLFCPECVIGISQAAEANAGAFRSATSGAFLAGTAGFLHQETPWRQVDKGISDCRFQIADRRFQIVGYRRESYEIHRHGETHICQSTPDVGHYPRRSPPEI